MSMAKPSDRNHYELLQIPQTASSAEIKALYHRLLLSHHPDKSDPSKDRPTQTDIDIGLLKEAFTTLFSPESRMKYDSELSSHPHLSSPRSQPAHIVSLEDLEDRGQVWTYDCQCGGQYSIEEEDMEEGVHLTACSSCSEVIWMGYEACSSGDDDTAPGGS
jgi:diphthamide biosynthesis protein 4